MPVSWFLLSLALGRSPVVSPLERLMESKDAVRCSPGLSCHLWGGDVLCLPGSIVSAPGPVLVPTRLQTELVLRCRQETDCDLCMRVAVHVAVQGHWKEPGEEGKSGPGQEGSRNGEENQPSELLLLVRIAPTAGHTDACVLLTASLQAQVLLAFHTYPAARCALLEVHVPAALVQPGHSVGSVIFDCFEADLGAEVQIWSYTQPRYQKELDVTQQLPDCRGLEVRDSIQSCRALPWLNVSSDGDSVRLVLDISKEQHFGLLLYWNQVQGPPRTRWQSNLTGPQTILLNHTDLVPCLCIQVWPLEPDMDAVRTSFCPFQEDPRAHRNLWRTVRLRLLSPLSWQLEAPCSLPVEVALCWQGPDQSPCQPLVPPLPRENITVNKAYKFPLLRGHPNLCVQVSSWKKIQLQECLWAESLGPLKDDMLLVETRSSQDNTSLCALELSGCTPLPNKASRKVAHLGEQLLQDLQSGQCTQLWDDDLGAFWACPTDNYIHKRWALVWLVCLLFVAALFFFLLLKRKGVKAAEGRAALLLHCAEGAGFERLVGALASALSQLPLRVAVDLWSRRELSAQGALAWFHGQRRQTLQEDGVVLLLFSPGAVALCHAWLQDLAPEPGPLGPHDAFAASLSCVLPDFLQGRASGRYLGVCFDGLLRPDAVPALFRAVPVFSLPSQLPAFLGALQAPGASHPRRLAERAEQVSRTLQPALDSYFRPPGAPARDSCFRPPGAPGRGAGRAGGPGTGDWA